MKRKKGTNEAIGTPLAFSPASCPEHRRAKKREKILKK
jgi:hypothetical protein